MATRRRRSDEFDDFDDDDYDDDELDERYEDDDFDEPPRRRQRSRTAARGRSGSARRSSTKRRASAGGGVRNGARKSGRKKKSASGTPAWVLPASIGAGVLLLAVVVLGIVFAMSGDDDDSAKQNDTANNAGPADPGANAGGNVAPPSDPNAFAPAGNNGGNNPAGGNPAANGPIPLGRFWVVLSNFQVRDAQLLNKEISISYRVVSGRPEPGETYKIRVETGSVGLLKRYTELDVDNFAKPTGNASVRISGSGVVGSQFTAFAIKRSGGDGEPVSAKIRPGGGATSSSPPASAAQIAGGAAQGKAVALANPRVERGFAGRSVYVVDFEVIGTLQPGKRYNLIIKPGSGSGVSADITTDLRKKRGSLKVSPIGSLFGGSFEWFIESGGSGIIRTGRETVESNVVRS